jgi:muramidase (phage lysozyme)
MPHYLDEITGQIVELEFEPNEQDVVALRMVLSPGSGLAREEKI